MATEKILMACVERGQSRQEMHEIIREYSVEAGRAVKEAGRKNDLLVRLAEDSRIPFSLEELEGMVSDYQAFTGRATQQTRDYLAQVIAPLLERHRELVGGVDSSLAV